LLRRAVSSFNNFEDSISTSKVDHGRNSINEKKNTKKYGGDLCSSVDEEAGHGYWCAEVLLTALTLRHPDLYKKRESN
jgi:hypothetical protein